MSKMIRARISDDLKERLEQEIKKIKEEAPLGVKVNESTVLRGAIIEFLNKFEEGEKEQWRYEMGTKQISARVDEQLLEEVNSIIEEFNRESTNGAMLDLASVVRYSLKKYVQEQKRQ